MARDWLVNDSCSATLSAQQAAWLSGCQRWGRQQGGNDDEVWVDHDLTTGIQSLTTSQLFTSFSQFEVDVDRDNRSTKAE